MPDGEAESTACPCLPKSPVQQLDSPSPVPGAPAPAQICFRGSVRMGALAAATPAQPALLPRPLLWHSVTSSNWALRLEGGKCPSFKSSWLQTLHNHLSPHQPRVPSSWAAATPSPTTTTGAPDSYIWRGSSKPNITWGHSRVPARPSARRVPPHTQSAGGASSATSSEGRNLGTISSLPVSQNGGRGTPNRPGRAEPEETKEEGGKSQAKREKSERVKEKERGAK